MPQVVRRDVGQPHRAHGRVEDEPAPVAQPQHRPARCGEQEVVSVLAGAPLRQGVDEKLRERDGALLVRLGGAEHRLAGDLGNGLSDRQASAEEVDASDPQRGHLAKAQAGVREQADDVPVLARCVCEALDLVPRQEAGLVPGDPWQRHPLSRVSRYAAVADGEVQQQGQHPVGLSDGGRREAALERPRHPGSHVGMPDVGETVRSPGRQDVRAKKAGVALPRARLEADLRRQPLLGPYRDGDPAPLRCGPGMRDERRGGFLQPSPGVDLAGEAPLVLPPAGIAIASAVASRPVTGLEGSDAPGHRARLTGLDVVVDSPSAEVLQCCRPVDDSRWRPSAVIAAPGHVPAKWTVVAPGC
nr:hypothetical protein [Geodermatophilus amargosae]